MAAPAGTIIQRCIIGFVIHTDDVEVSEALQEIAGYVSLGGATTLAALYGWRFFRPLIGDVINRVFGGDDQEALQIVVGSLHVKLDCFTAERFLEVLHDYETGRIKERLEKEFSEFGFKVEGMKIQIENIDEVNEKKDSMNNKSPMIIVQGGFYRKLPTDKKEQYKAATVKAAQAGYVKLMENGTAVDAVEAAVRVLEDDELFNAGFGSSLNNDGEVECEAMIMEGHTLKSGAVISGRHFRNPVSLAKVIMEKSNHCALSGNGALKFANEQNFPTSSPDELVSEKIRATVSNRDFRKWQKFYMTDKSIAEDSQSDDDHREEQDSSTDTVSAIALDVHGHFACAMSTGGASGKLKGRVGDAPMVGCGGYANKTGAATVTGFGESIIKVTLAREVVFNMEKRQDAQKSAEDGLQKLKKEPVKSRGGVIAIDKDGNFGKHFTTKMMAWARIKDNEIEYGMEENEVLKGKHE